MIYTEVAAYHHLSIINIQIEVPKMVQKTSAFTIFYPLNKLLPANNISSGSPGFICSTSFSKYSNPNRLVCIGISVTHQMRIYQIFIFSKNRMYLSSTMRKRCSTIKFLQWNNRKTYIICS